MSETIYQCDVAIIGSGPAGQKAAIQAVKSGKKVIVIEQEAKVGGACVHRGTIPSKTLRETAASFIGFRRRTGNIFKLELNEETQISTLMKRLEQVIKAHELYMGHQLERNGVDLWHGRARFIDANTIEVVKIDRTKHRIQAKTILIAAGSQPRNPDNIQVDHQHILDSDSILSMIYLPKSLMVLGAGVIACEYATIFASLGVQVTILDKTDRPLGFLDPEITDRFVKCLEEMNGRFIPKAALKSCVWNGVDQVITTLESGEEISTEKCLFALGRVACLKGLQIEAAGLKATDRGVIPRPEFCQTTVPHIYAAGDVIGPPSLASSSMEQGRRAMLHALGLPIGKSGETLPMGIYTIPEMSSVGLSEAEAIKRNGSAVVGRAKFAEVARGQIAAIQDGVLKLVCDPQGKKLLGVHILGEGATDLIHVGQMALYASCDVDVFVDNIFNFPTMTEAYRVAAFDAIETRSKKAI